MRFALDEVESYLRTKLRPQLLGFGVSESFTDLTLPNIEARIYSLIRIWKNESARRAVLAIGMEEGLFYRPNAKPEIRFFVVVAIRNSLLETICSDECRDAGLSQPLNDDQIKLITQSAITHFGKLDFMGLSMQTENAHQYTYYQDILSKYPVSVEALKRICLMDGKVTSYQKIESAPMSIPEINSTTNHRLDAISKVVQNGISADFDSALLSLLRDVESGSLAFFYTQCFKMLTRNFDKLMRIMEYVLTHDTPFVTNNYYIENGYIEKRPVLARAQHSASVHKSNLICHPGAGKKHRCALNMVMEEIAEEY